MIAASALLTADDATPQLVAQAVHQALDRAQLVQASEVILFLTPEFARHAAAAVTAASRAGGSLQVFGSVAAGVASDEGWAMDRPAVAALVLGNRSTAGDDEAPGGASDASSDASLAASSDTSLAASLAASESSRSSAWSNVSATAASDTDDPPAILSLCGSLHLPAGWLAAPPRCGLLYTDSLSSAPTPVWQGARVMAGASAELRVKGCAVDLAMSTGVDVRTERLRVETSAANELIRICNPATGLSESAAASLKRVLPASLREQRPLPIHLASAALHTADAGGEPRLIPILSANADGSITLSETVPRGSTMSWAIRLPADAEADMRRVVDLLERRNRQRRRGAAFGLFLSCIGRGPFFFAGEDRDLNLFRRTFPDLPFVGAYGSGQIAPGGSGNLLVQNSVVTALFSPLR